MDELTTRDMASDGPPALASLKRPVSRARLAIGKFRRERWLHAIPQEHPDYARVMGEVGELLCRLHLQEEGKCNI